MSSGFVPTRIGGINDRRSAGRHVPGKRIQRKITWLAIGHGPGPESLVADPDTGFGPVSREIEGSQVGHAEIEIVLVGIRGDRGRASHHRDFTFYAGGLRAKIVGSSFDDQLRFAVFELRRSLHSGLKGPVAIGAELPEDASRGQTGLPDFRAIAVLL